MTCWRESRPTTISRCWRRSSRVSRRVGLSLLGSVSNLPAPAFFCPVEMGRFIFRRSFRFTASTNEFRRRPSIHSERVFWIERSDNSIGFSPGAPIRHGIYSSSTTGAPPEVVALRKRSSPHVMPTDPRGSFISNRRSVQDIPSSRTSERAGIVRRVAPFIWGSGNRLFVIHPIGANTSSPLPTPISRATSDNWVSSSRRSTGPARRLRRARAEPRPLRS